MSQTDDPSGARDRAAAARLHQSLRVFGRRSEEARAREHGSNADDAWMALGSGVLFEQAMAQTRMAVVITDPRQSDNPIVFANNAFLALSGYEGHEVVGRNCRFMQAEETDRAEVARLRAAIEGEEVVVVEILNRRKDGSTFWNALHVGPIYDEAGELAHFFGSQWDVTDVVAARAETQRQRVIARELHHRIRNLFAVISSVVTLSARGERDVASAVEKARARILALGRAHEATLAPRGARGEPSDLRSLVETVLRPHGSEAPGRLQVEGAPLSLPPVLVTPMGLALHELATNALKHGALGAPDGRVSVAWAHEGGALRVRWREEGCPAARDPAPEDGAAARASGGRSGMGGRIVEDVLRTVDGTIEREWRAEGLRAEICVPLPPEATP